ncbi:hypothetical protein [Tenuibacillus multivorans]|uniref:Cytochrome C and Quinol oxidase polypeptide I n=1 Tax=Tenuibacillus multivorans TaxID=237069 RepID=A0A1G9WQB4_9BACI|nr:hypothetical protein [Tenuibacillus multivorans]GEL77974.1 hypothetical protein TMU01_22090 [Tenuibacillus multivorans]SDM86629.1 hypothetical protein SAMN05216498_0843 [Tenuibacillus multivorans]
MENYSKLLLRFSALFAVVGAFIGSHMAGTMDYQFKSIHAHILVVGWLTLFAWAVFYKVFYKVKSNIAILHVWSGILGSFGLTTGMWLYFVRPFGLPDGLVTVYFIVGGTTLLVSFILFFLLTLRNFDRE